MARSLCIFALAIVIGCHSAEEKSITLATTTSARDSGLLDELLPTFERESGIDVQMVAVGSGQALELGRRGDADVLLTHAPESEERFMAEGHGSRRHLVMHNDFILVGPKSDPAGVSGQESITDAFSKLAKSTAAFVSRDDESGTHQKERQIWEAAGLELGDNWYIRAGSGMVQTLQMANEKRAYTLTDRGTYLAQRKALDLAILFHGDPLLRNEYAVILVNPAKHSHVNAEGARRFADFLLSPKTQSMVGRFGIEQFGEPLFFPTLTSPFESAAKREPPSLLRNQYAADSKDAKR